MIKPMLASPADLDKIRYPVWASPKLDGIRAMNVDGKLMSRSMKPIPNKYVNHLFSHRKYAGLDGELIVGRPFDKNVIQATTSGVMSVEGTPDVTWYVFDKYDHPGGFKTRLGAAGFHMYTREIHTLIHKEITSADELLDFERITVEHGYEGIMIRDPHGPYKFGRSTAKEGYLLKVKRFEDSEAVVIGVEPEYHNTNEAQTNELGRTKRSSAKDGLIAKNTMGALVVRDIHTGAEFNIGTGFTAVQRQLWWQDRVAHIMRGTIVKYKFFPVGVKDAPRHPVFLAVRDPRDM